MTDKTPIINILTFGLPFDLAKQIYNEYQGRLKDIKYLLEKSPRFNNLIEFLDTISLLLALSIFHKRVVSNLDAAVKFYGTVNNYSQADTITIGRYEFTIEEKNKLLALLISYRKLIDKYGISENLMNYYETKEFLIKIKYFKNWLDNAEERTDNNKKNDNQEDFPF